MEHLLASLPGQVNAAILVTQHMTDRFTGIFALRLDRICQLSVKEARGGEMLKGGEVLVAPAGSHLKVNSRGETRLDQGPPVNYVRPAADVMMLSMARYLSPVIGVVLTGMGKDGAQGAKAIRDAGGVVLVQSPKQALISSMPQAAINAGAASMVLPLEEIPGMLLHLIARGQGGMRVENGPVVI